MGLLGNGFRHNLTGRITTATTSLDGCNASTAPAGRNLVAFRRNMLAGSAALDSRSSVPHGCRHPVAWLMPQVAGAMSSRILGDSSVSDADAWAVKLADAALTGSGDLTAFGGLIVQLIAAITGSGAVTNADVKAFLSAVASLTGSGTISSAVRTGLGALLASVTGDGTATGSTLTGTGELDADIVAYGDLTPEGIRDAVWAQIVEAGFTAEQILRLLAAHAAGAATGLEGADMRYTGLDGKTTRIDGNYSGGTRTIDSLDAD